MGLTIVDRAEAAVVARRVLGVSPDAALGEVVAKALRRAASVSCPTTPGALAAAVTVSLSPLLGEDGLDDDLVSQVLERLVAVGDLVEAVDDRDGVRRGVLFLGRPRFVVRANGDALLIGVRPDGLPIVSEELLDEVNERSYVRRIVSRPDLAEVLRAEGLAEINATRWLRAPEAGDMEEVISSYDSRLRTAGPSGEIEGLRILDPATPTTYYRGRWREPGPQHTGNFVSRRGQRFGAELWAYVALEAGTPLRLLDLPALTADRGCDEAWRLLSAVDAANGHPQQIVVKGTGQGRVALGLNFPPPRWLQRRWELIGEATRVRGTLFAFEFSVSDVREELQFASDRLWLTRHVTLSEDSQ